MGFYQRHLLPWLIDVSCSAPAITRQRRRVVPGARGEVLEIGVGSGLNLAHYDPQRVKRVWALEPSQGMRERAAKAVAASPFEVRWLDLEAETIPLESASVDTVVVTFTLCTIADPMAALRQMRRVLKPGGELLFAEHGQAPDAGVRRWQQRLNPLWNRIGGGCHINRPIDELIEAGGFRFNRLEQGYLPKTPQFLGYNYWGSAG